MKMYNTCYVTGCYCVIDKYKKYSRIGKNDETVDCLNIASNSITSHSTRKAKTSVDCV